jgi:hypothetical protein
MDIYISICIVAVTYLDLHYSIIHSYQVFTVGDHYIYLTGIHLPN